MLLNKYTCHIITNGSKDVFFGQIIDDDVHFHWSMLSLDIEDEHHSAELLKTIVNSGLKSAALLSHQCGWKNIKYAGGGGHPCLKIATVFKCQLFVL